MEKVHTCTLSGLHEWNLASRLPYIIWGFPLSGRSSSALRADGVSPQAVEGPQCPLRVYHCLPPCRAGDITKARLEGLFVDELERFRADARLHAGQ